jgi:predicted ferric reductase
MFFHPITVSSFDELSGEITIYVKSFGEGTSQWSGQLLAAAKLVQSGALTLKDIGLHVGGPNGGLMIKEPLEDLNQIIMISGGIGCTPMCAILEHLAKEKYPGVVDFLWSTRSTAELDAFRPLFAKCAGMDNFHVNVHFTGKKDSEVPVPGGPGFILKQGRPDIEKIVVDKNHVVGVMCCGPDAMMNSTEAYVYDKQGEGFKMIFHKETFEF